MDGPDWSHDTEIAIMSSSVQIELQIYLHGQFLHEAKLARTISKFSDNDVKVIGTVCGNFIDGATRENVMKAIADLKDKPRNSWYLVRALEADKTPPLKKKKSSIQHYG